MHPMIKLAANYALAHKYEDNIGFYLCALIVKGGSVISVGYNGSNINGYVRHLAKFDNSAKWFQNRHAEVDAILKARAKTDLTGCKLFVVRTRPSGGVGMARPCECCQHAIQRYGIKRVYYSISDFEYGILNVAKVSDKVLKLKDAV